MSKKDFIAFAKMLKERKPDCDTYDLAYMNWVAIVQGTADIFAESNPNFNRDRFYDACDHVHPLYSNKR